MTGNQEVINTIIAGASAFVGAMAGVGAIAWWLASKFNRVYERISSVKEILMTKIEDHEKLDSERFNGLNLAVMRIELRSGTQSPFQIGGPSVPS